MICLTKSLSALGTPAFLETLKQEVEDLGAGHLPLQQGLSTGSYAIDDGLQAMILSVSEGPTTIQVRVGLFYSGIIAGCSCADDPTPVDEVTEYCEVQLSIDKATGETTVAPLSDAGRPDP
jgi:hypothetical protein